MNWTPELVTAVTTSIVTLITAIGTFIVTIRTKNIVQSDAVAKDEKLHDIQEKVDGRLSEALAETKGVRAEVKELQHHIMDKK